MKAPDKIFVPTRFRLVDGLRVRESDTDEEYIRKDTLLEWIKDQLKENEEWQEVNPDDRFFGGKEVAFNRIIDKINSL